MCGMHKIHDGTFFKLITYSEKVFKAGSEIRDQVRESIWILAVEFCKNPWILTI